MVSCSIGSCFTPSISLMITCGWPTCNSYPSRRIVSIRTERCNTPLPYTSQESALSVFSTCNARFLSSSSIKRSCICRDVTNFPSCPKNGEVLIVNNIDIVGSSIAIVGSGSGFKKSVIVSPISNPSIPTNAQISPDSTSSIFTRPRPSKTFSSFILTFFTDPSRLHNA